jgi:hypothetical protein
MMSSDLSFTEDGLKIQATIADKMDELLATAAAGTALGGPTVGGVIAAAVFVMELIDFLGGDDEEKIMAALNRLQQQIDEIKGVLVVLDQRLDEMVQQAAIESNRQTLRDLLDYLDDFRILQIRLRDQPGSTDVAVSVANEAGVVLDKFLRNDHEIWRWTDVVEKEFRDPASGQTRHEPALATLRFKNVPTLPAYLMGMLTWLAARERAVQAGQRARLIDDRTRLERHHAATMVRTDFDKYADGAAGIPHSLQEHIKWRIRGHVIAGSTYADRDGFCAFHFDIGNLMIGRRVLTTEPFSLAMQAGHGSLCTVNPSLLGAPLEEVELEDKSGCAPLQALSDVLARLVAGGSLRGQFIGQFPTTEVYAPAILYLVDLAGDLQWYQLSEASRPGGSDQWRGPIKVGNGWNGFTRVFNGGGAAIYAIRPNGDLMWYGHDGFFEGTRTWRDPVQVGNGWNGFQHVFPGGEYVVYGVRPDGRLLWYRHDGAPHGGDVTTWSGPREVAAGFGGYQTVMSGGDGLIHGIRPDGALIRHEHRGHADGTADWAPAEQIGTGWQNFRTVVACPDGVFLAFTTNGTILWYRYGDRPVQFAIIGGRRVPISLPGKRWEGPVEIRRRVPGLLQAFAGLAAPFRGPN